MLAQDNPPYIRDVRIFDPDFFMPNAAGLAFSPQANIFLLLADLSIVQPPVGPANLTMITPFENLAGSVNLPTIANPINMTFDSQANRLLLLDTAANELIAIKAKPTGYLDPTAITHFEVQEFGLQDPQGMTIDPATGRLYILDSASSQIARIEPDAQHSFDGAAALKDGRISRIDLNPLGLEELQGLAFNPTNGHLYFLSPFQLKLYEVTETGQLVATRDLPNQSDLLLRDPQGIVFAPSGDMTDDPSRMDLYLVDSGLGSVLAPPSGKYEIYLPLIIKQSQGSDVPSEQSAAPGTANEGEQAEQGPGRLIELSLTPLVQIPPSVSAMAASLVNTIDTSQWSPPSPDPSGLTYLPNSNRLMMSDGEVEETVNGITHFQGANVWEFTLSGSVLRTANISKKAPTVVSMTDEPTGVTWNPVNGHYFFTDDGQKEVFDLNPGSDGLVGTTDDSWTHFDTLAVGNGDPEGITFDTWHNRLFVADGVNREVYQYTLTGSLVSHFDVQTYGVEDPETVEFNPDSGTLFVMSSNRTNPLIVETTISGGLVQPPIDISAANPRQTAGLAYAPASNGSGTKRFYIVDRGIDNNSDPRIIDGKVYEMTAPSSTPANTPTPTNTPTPGPTPTPTNTPTSSDLIFADGFESSNLSAWSSSTTDGGDLSVSGVAALVGSKGLQAVIDDNNTIYVTDDGPTAEPRYRARFYFDPNSISMVSGDSHNIFRGLMSSSTNVLRVEFRFSSGNYQLRAGLRDDGSTWTSTSWFTISDAAHFIELDWRAATAAGANNGSLTLWIDGTQQANLTGVDNDTRRIDHVRLGAVAAIDTGTRGTYYFDAFESRRQTFIGP